MHIKIHAWFVYVFYWVFHVGTHYYWGGTTWTEVTVLNPSDLCLKVKTCFSQKRYGCEMERLKMRTNENKRSTADDGITACVYGNDATQLQFMLQKLKTSKSVCPWTNLMLTLGWNLFHWPAFPNKKIATMNCAWREQRERPYTVYSCTW
jgi:hypothetical protein